jgi:membrane-associated phospholipid phosphatase
MALTGTLAGLMAQFFKRILFPGIKRPFIIFKEIPGFYIVQGVDMHSSFSFPSGHSATIFAVCLILAAMSRNKILKIILFLMALIVGFSRVYLSQHFLIDFYAGSFLGILSVLIVVGFLDQRKAAWLDNSITEVIQRRVKK